MKKQLLIAAVAATMTSVAIADISITGGAKVNYENKDVQGAMTNTISHDVDFTVVGKNGGTAVSMTLATTESGATDKGLAVEDTFLTTTIGDIAIKTGTWMSGDDMLNETSRANGKFEASTTFSGVKVAYFDYDSANESSQSVKLSGSVADVALSAEMGSTFDTYTVDADVAGFGVSYKLRAQDAADEDKSSVMLTKDVSGVTLTYAQADADTGVTLEGDSWLGDYEDGVSTTQILKVGDDVSGFGAKMAMAGNTVQVKRITVDREGSVNKDIDYTKFYVTRPLASGATFELTYTDADVDGSTASDSETLDLELAVKF